MAKTATKIKREAQPVPQDADEVSDAIYRIGEHQRALARLEADHKDRVAALKAEFELHCQPHNDEIKGLADGVHGYCEARRAELTDDGKRKLAKFTSGEVAWRLNPPKVAIKRGVSAELLLELFKARKLDRFIRTKEELNKEAVLAEPDAIAGMKEIAIDQTEQFVIKPAESESETVL